MTVADPTTEQSRLLLTFDEVAERLGTTRRYIHTLVQAGRMQSVRLGRLHRIRATDLDAFVATLPSAAQ